MFLKLSVLAAVLTATATAGKVPSPTPPMGWMSWEIFRCEVDCDKFPDSCINADLYEAQTLAMVSGGYRDAGYNTIHIDDCWMQKNPPRSASGELVANSTRFPKGMKALGDFMHSHGVQFGTYTAESSETCGGYPASANHETIDAKTFASWGVDYLKVDGCGPADYYPKGYPAMGAALEDSGRAIVYSCSWPAYLGSNETTKPYSSVLVAGCNLWRSWADIQCNSGSLFGIIDHFGDYASTMRKYSGPTKGWTDMDMLLIGNDCITDDEARTQMAIWSILAAPLIMGNDLRNVSTEQRNILLNMEAIAVNQDPLGEMGRRVSPKGSQEVWARNLSNGVVAVGLLNKAQSCDPVDVNGKSCTFTHSTGSYVDGCGDEPNLGTFFNLSVEEAQAKCCGNSSCAGFSYNRADGSGYLKANANGGVTKNAAYDGYLRNGLPTPTAANITVTFADVGITASKVLVHDIWSQKDVGVYSGSYTTEVNVHGTAFLRLSAAA